MFSLKFDLLFPSFEAAKETARKLNAALQPAAPFADPRDHQRMLEELRLARDRSRLQSVVHRNLFL